MGKKRGITDQAVALLGIQERHKTIRQVVWAVALVSVVGIVGYVTVKTQRPPWLQLAVVMLPAPIVMSVFWICVMRKFQSYMAKDHQRTKELEEQADPNRTTSRLKADGSFDHDI